jgi:hypothetical protein
MIPRVAHLGHSIDAKGLHPLPDKVKAIQEAPCPKNDGAKIILDLAPLYQLLETGTREGIPKSKELMSSQLLVHFDSQLPLTLACDVDTSAYLYWLIECQMEQKNPLTTLPAH